MLMRDIAKKTVNRLTFGKAFEAFRASLLSVFDVFTDCLTVKVYFDLGSSYAGFLVVLVVGTLMMQLTMVAFLHRKDRKAMFRECLYTVTFLKPAVNQLRVSSGGSGGKEAARTGARANGA